MKVDVQKLDKSKVELQVEVTEEQVAAALDKAYHKVVKQVNVPGFRKGKVPRAILEMRYGVEVLYDEALDILLPEAYEAALNESKVEPIDRPEVEVVKFEKGQPASFKFVVQTPPEVELGEYKGVEVEKPSFPVTEADVDQALQNMQEQHARLVDSSAEQVESSDYITLDYEGFVDGEAFAGGQANDHSLQIGSGTFIPGFEEQLIGYTRGQEGEINVTFPEDYRNNDLAGKAAVFKVQVKDIKRKELPELNDDFAAEVGEHETLEELRAEVKNKLQEAAAERERNLLEANVVNKITANATVEIPNVMIEREIDEMVDDLAQNLTRQGFPEEFAREYIDSRKDAIRADYRETAENRVKTRLVLNQVKVAEGIAATSEEIDSKINELAELYKQEPAQIREALERQDGMENLASSIATEKTVAMLVDAAKQVEKSAEEAPAVEDDKE